MEPGQWVRMSWKKDVNVANHPRNPILSECPPGTHLPNRGMKACIYTVDIIDIINSLFTCFHSPIREVGPGNNNINATSHILSYRTHTLPIYE